MSKKITFYLFLVLLVMFSIFSALGYDVFAGSKGRFFSLFSSGFLGFSRVFCVFLISVMIVFAFLVFIAAIVDLFKNKEDSDLYLDN